MGQPCFFGDLGNHQVWNEFCSIIVAKIRFCKLKFAENAIQKGNFEKRVNRKKVLRIALLFFSQFIFSNNLFNVFSCLIFSYFCFSNCIFIIKKRADFIFFNFFFSNFSFSIYGSHAHSLQFQPTPRNDVNVINKTQFVNLNLQNRNWM